MTRVGLVGLGVMGTAVAARLGELGWEVVTASRSIGITPAEAVAKLGTQAVVLTTLPGGREVREVVFGEHGLLSGKSRLTLVDLSTCAPEDARSLARRLRSLGHRAVDAPVSGGPGGARAGTLSIMAGGRDDDVAAAGAVLAALGTVVRCGGPGSGQVVKAANQLLVAAGLVAVAESLTLARRCGVDPAVARTALLGGFAASRVLELQGDRMVRRDFATRGSAGLLAKDIGIIRQLAGQTGVRTSVLEAAGTVVDRLTAADPGIDHSAVLTVVEEAVT